MTYQKPTYIDVEITSLSKEGHGIGCFHRADGKIFPVEVPFTLPGDQARALLLGRKRGSYQSRLEMLIQPSPDRIAARCIHFGSCGGCRWQQMAYEQQLKQKELWIHECLAPYLNDQIVFHPILPCIPPWQYRNKMEFSFTSDQAGKKYLGLMLYGRRGKAFELTECHLVYPWMAEAVGNVQSWWKNSQLDAYHPLSNNGSLRTLTLREGRRSGDRLVMLTVSGNPDFALNKKQVESFVAGLQAAIEPQDPDQKLSIFLRIQQISKGRPTNFYEMLLYGPDHIREILYIQQKENQSTYPLTFRISPVAFFQPNTSQAERLYSRALQLINIPQDAVVYDLYCGTGTLGICAAKIAYEVIGIELTPESVLDARENIKLNDLNNIKVLQGDVGKVLKQLTQDGYKQPDVVMVDPPRAGLDSRALAQLLEIKAPKLLYISCNPMTQSANLKELIQGGYHIEAIQPVDQFPQTVHVENIVTLSYGSLKGVSNL